MKGWAGIQEEAEVAIAFAAGVDSTLEVYGCHLMCASVKDGALAGGSCVTGLQDPAQCEKASGQH